MLALKKKREAEAKARAEQEAAVKAEEASRWPAEASSGATTTDTTTSAETASVGKVSLLGIGGKKKAPKNIENGEPSGKKRTPCEIRIQKG